MSAGVASAHLVLKQMTAVLCTESPPAKPSMMTASFKKDHFDNRMSDIEMLAPNHATMVGMSLRRLFRLAGTSPGVVPPFEHLVFALIECTGR